MARPSDRVVEKQPQSAEQEDRDRENQRGKRADINVGADPETVKAKSPI